jgi:hypothetical protein
VGVGEVSREVDVTQASLLKSNVDFLLTKSFPLSLDSLSSIGNKRTPPKLKSVIKKKREK